MGGQNIRGPENPSNFKKNVKLSSNALKVLEKRYLLKDSRGKICESPEGMFRRVSQTMARIDRLYDSHSPLEKIENEFYNVMSQMEFLPNSPTLMNANTVLNQLSACLCYR